MIARRSAQVFWVTLGGLAVVLGVIGVALPLLPTTPFLLVAVFAFARSSPRLHDWLVGHRRFGPLIDNWQRYGAIDRRSKVAAMVVIGVTPIVTLIIGVPMWALGAQIAVLSLVATFILTRPNGPVRTVTAGGLPQEKR